MGLLAEVIPGAQPHQGGRGNALHHIQQHCKQGLEVSGSVVTASNPCSQIKQWSASGQPQATRNSQQRPQSPPCAAQRPARSSSCCCTEAAAVYLVRGRWRWRYVLRNNRNMIQQVRQAVAAAVLVPGHGQAAMSCHPALPCAQLT